MKSFLTTALAISLFVSCTLAFPMISTSEYLKGEVEGLVSLSSTAVVYADDFSTNTAATYSTSGQIGGSAWSVNRSGPDWGARRNSLPQQLELTNDVGASSNSNGWVFAYTSTTSFSSPYSSTLSGNPDIVTWTFNMRQSQADPGGFVSDGSFGVAFILATTSNDPSLGSGKNGYAVTLGEPLAVDRVRLVRFASGLQGTITPLITSNTTGLLDLGAEYLSIRVTYDPSNNQWQLFLRNDGTSGFADPNSGSLTLQGTTSNSTYVATSLTTMGAYWQGSTAAGQSAYFDNLSVQVGSTSAQPGAFSFDPSSYSLNEGDGSATITVKRGGGSDGPVTVDYGATGVSATGGASCGFGSGVDYVVPSGTLTFGDGVDTQTFNLILCNDQLYEGSESLNLTLSNPTGGATIATGSAVTTISDNDDQPVVEFSTSSSSIGEADGLKTFTVNRSGASENAFAVDFSTVDDTALGGTCVSGSDYVATNGTLNFLAGDTNKSFTAAICDDSIVEGSETFTASLSSPTGGVGIGPTGSETVTINDDDTSVQFGAPYYAKREGSTVSVAVTRAGVTSGSSTINYSVSSGNAIAGTCGTPGADFATPSGSVGFAAGETSKNINIEICSDTLDEDPNETFILHMDSANGATVGSQGDTTVSILESLQKSMWVFGGSSVPNPVSDAVGRSALVSHSFYAGIRELYVSVYQSGLNSNGRRMYEDSDMATLNAFAHSAGQGVWAAYGDTNWPTLTAGCSGSSFPETRMAEVAAFNASRPPNERFDGVMLDVEPSPTTEAEFQALIAHYECMRSRLPVEVKLGVAISAFWDDDVIDYPAVAAFSSKPVSSHIIDLPLDRVVVMGYRDLAGTGNCPSSNGMICLDKDEVEYASSIGKEGLVFAGLETMELPGQDSVTFNEEGQIGMEAEAGQVGSFFDASSGMGGFAIHNYKAAYLGGAPGWPAGPSAAPASISGRALTASGGGVQGVIVVVRDMNGVEHFAITNTFGYYSVADLETGRDYVVTVSARKYRFASASRVVKLDDNVDGLNFVASP